MLEGGDGAMEMCRGSWRIGRVGRRSVGLGEGSGEGVSLGAGGGGIPEGFGGGRGLGF